MITLNKPAVSDRQTEKAVQELFNEFLGKFFTGTPHATLRGPVTFPVVDLFFNQTQLPAPAAKPQIHIVFTDFRPIARWADDTTKEVTTDSLFTVYFRAANQGATDNKSDFACRSVADNFKELFESEERYALARKGIRHSRIQSGPKALQATGYQARMLILLARIRYDVARSAPINA